MTPESEFEPATWPTLPPLDAWEQTLETVHRWVQIIGKIRLEETHWTNHAWHVPLYVTPCGLTTSTIFHGSRGFAIDFDFIRHRLELGTSEGEQRSFMLEPMSVAAFYAKLMRALAELELDVHIRPVPVEIPGTPVPFPSDQAHAAYDPEPMQRYFAAMAQAYRVLSDFRTRFIGKVSPVHFFWGGFDLAVSRFSGRPAPRHPGGAPNCPDWVMQEAYSHELSSAGFWPGAGLGEAAFYSYAYPEPPSYRDHPVQPARAARYHESLREFILPYEAVRAARDPDATLLAFLQTSYDAAASLGGWDRAALERPSVAMTPVAP